MAGNGENRLISLGSPDSSIEERHQYEEPGSGSRNPSLDVVPGDVNEEEQGGTPKQKKYHRHSAHQIQELESYFHDCPHPDENQRFQLSQRIGLEPNQVKFWFQNRRTQMKAHMERHENIALRHSNEKLLVENEMLKDALRSPLCKGCGNVAVPGEVIYEEQHLSIENARLKDDLSRICSLANLLSGSSPEVQPIDFSLLDSSRVVDPSVPGLIIGGTSGAAFTVGETNMMYERSKFIDLGLLAMEELVKLADSDSPFWIRDMENGKEKLNYDDEYRSLCSGTFGVKPHGFVDEASRETGLVHINSLTLVETLMDANRWVDVLSCIVPIASTIEVVMSGEGGSKNGCLQLMQAEFQVISPLVPTRLVKFVRYCKRHGDNLWAVVDVSTDPISREDSNPQCRRLPSGCIIQDMGNGCSKVTWVEHWEYDERNIHLLYRSLLSSGYAFGAQRCLASLQRQCEGLAMYSSSLHIINNPTGLPLSGTKNLLKLAERMMYNFYAGMSASSVCNWVHVVANVGEDVRVMGRMNVSNPGEPMGLLLNGATSVWLPVHQRQIFDFLRDSSCRNQWDILSNFGYMQQIARLPKSHLHDANAITLYHTPNSNVLILQETWIDASGAAVVYAPVELTSMNMVMNGGDPAYVSLLPSGFSIAPDPTSFWPEVNGGGILDNMNRNSSTGGCLLTVGFQILVNTTPTAPLNVESIDTINSLISCTVTKIKASLP